MRIQPVRTEAEHDAAVTRIQQLMGAGPGTEASDELEVLVTLVDAYETKHFPIDTPDPVTIIKFQIEQQGMSRKDLEPMIGSRARVARPWGSAERTPEATMVSNDMPSAPRMRASCSRAAATSNSASPGRISPRM